MTLIDSEGQANKVTRKPACAPTSCGASSSHTDGASRGAIPPDENDDNASIILYLAGTIVNLAERVTALEAKLQEVTTASASQPKDDSIAASSATGTRCKKRRSDEEYRVPRWKPWELDSGWFGLCKLYWASPDSQENFTVCRSVWENVMSKIFADWKSNADWCYMKETDGHVETQVAQALVTTGAISTDEEVNVASSFRKRILKPDIANVARHLFLYHGGKAENKYITFGCIHCQRATTLYSCHGNFTANLRNYFP